MNATEYLIQLSESNATDFGKKDFADHSEPQKVFTTVFGSSGDIMMDGIASYVANSNGDSAHYAVRAYETIGALQCAGILKRAFKVISNDPIPRDDDERAELIAGLSEEQSNQLDDLTDEFIAYPEPFEELLVEYIRKHPDTFGKVPESVKTE